MIFTNASVEQIGAFAMFRCKKDDVCTLLLLRYTYIFGESS